jgi:DNA primase
MQVSLIERAIFVLPSVFGRPDEGIETMLSLRCALPRLPMVAALSANHLAALALPSGLRRVYIALDNDGAGRRAAEVLSARAEAKRVEPITLTPTTDDFNADLRLFGRNALARSLRVQLAPEDVERFLRR